MNQPRPSAARRRTIMSLVVVLVVAVAVGVWWTKIVAFSKTASVMTAYVDTTPELAGVYQGGLVADQALAVDDSLKQSLADKVASSRGGSAVDYADDLALTSSGTTVEITARGRTPSSAAELANSAAEALADIYNTDVPLDSSLTMTTTITRAK